jgi:hypothetical protein
MNVACRHYSDRRQANCAAVRGGVIPSLFERERFCLGGGAERVCPTYRLCEERGAPISAEQYFALWVAAADSPPG